MNRGIKVLWIVIAGVFALGIVLAGVGLALGATGTAWIDRNGLHLGPRYAEALEVSDLDSESFSNIDVQLVEADVELIVSDSYGYEFAYHGTREPIVEVNGDTLRVVENPLEWGFQLFGLWNFWDQDAVLKVYVPEDATFDSVTLHTASGETVLDGSNIDISQLDCKSASGDVKLSNLSLEWLYLDVASGNVTLKTVVATQADINMISGRLNCTGTEADSLTLNITSGDAFFEGKVVDELRLTMISGGANFELAGSENDYSFNIDRLSGDIRVNGRSVSEDSWPSSSFNNGNGRGRVDIETTSGSVNINFR